MYSSSAYAPFGEQYAKAGTNDQNFTGQQPDTAAGLYDFLFRRLSQTQGRWISPDPAGIAVVDPSAPQSWNRYGYVQNTPLRFGDLLGLDEAAPSWDCYDYAFCAIFVSGSGFVGDWVPDTWSAGGCQDIYSDGNYVGNTCGSRQQPSTQPKTADTSASTDVTDFKPLFCLGDAFAAKGLDVTLDALGAIPGLGNLVSGSVAGAKVIKTVSGVVSLATVRQGGRIVDGVLAYGGGIYSASSAAGEENALSSLVGAGSAGFGIGLALAGQTLGEGAKAIPVAGNIISGATGLWDIYQGIKAYKRCMASSKYN